MKARDSWSIHPKIGSAMCMMHAWRKNRAWCWKLSTFAIQTPMLSLHGPTYTTWGEGRHWLRIATKNINTLWVAAFTGMSAVVAKLLEKGFEDIEDSQSRSILIAALKGNHSSWINTAVGQDTQRGARLRLGYSTAGCGASKFVGRDQKLLGPRDIDLISRSDFGYTPPCKHSWIQADYLTHVIQKTVEGTNLLLSSGHTQNRALQSIFWLEIGYTQYPMKEKEDTRKRCSSMR